jgi:hypothetical protein
MLPALLREKAMTNRLRKWALSAVVFSPVLALAASCGGSKNSNLANTPGAGGAGASTSSGGSNSSSGVVAAPCLSDKDCREFDADAVCDSSRFVCVECLSDDDCGEASICVRGGCKDVTPCESTKQCSVEQVCNQGAGYCVECVADADCDDDQICVDAECRLSCDSDKVCRDLDQVCDTLSGFCAGCNTSADCEADEFCLAGSCESDVCKAGKPLCLGDAITLCAGDGEAWSEPFACDGECDISGDDIECDGFDIPNGSGGAGGGDGGGSGGAGGAAPTTECGSLIDDMEDGDGYTCPDDSRRGVWYTYVDSGIILPTGNPPDAELLSVPRAESSEYAFHVTGTGTSNPILGIDVQRDGDVYGSFDATGYTGIQFYMMTTSFDLQELIIRINTVATTSTAYGGTCVTSCYPNTYYYIYPSSVWGIVQLPFSYFSGGTAYLDESTITSIQFVSNYSTFDFWIDDVSFY